MNTNLSIKDFFIHVGVILSLYISVGSLITLLFQIVNIVYPDQLSIHFDPYSGPIRVAIAALIVLFPTFLILSWLTRREYQKNSKKHESGFRRFLVYLTLFIAGAIILGDLITLLNSFLGGEVSERFIFKVVILAIILGLVFGYYVYDLKRTIFTRTKTVWIFEIVAIALVLGSIILGFAIMGSPTTQRQLRFDSQRVSDLQNIQYQIVNYWQLKQSLPRDLSLLINDINGYRVPTDPETSAGYNYEITGTLSFKLCATFDKETSSQSSLNNSYPVSGLGTSSENWKHSVGQACFDRTIDPELHKPILMQ